MSMRIEGRVRMLACDPVRAVKRKANIGGADAISREWIRAHILVVCFMAFAAPACGPAYPRRVVQEVVPPSLVPAGFIQEECWYETGPEENPLFRGNFGLPGGAGEPPSPMLHILDRRIRCRHVRKEQPSPVVEDRNRVLPRQAPRGGPDGLTRGGNVSEEG